MPNIGEIVGGNIRAVRRARGLTQETLAEMVDVSGSYMGYLERGKKRPSLDLLVKIADSLDVDPAMLLISTDEETNRELERLVVMLSGKGPAHVKFVSDVAVAYLKSLGEAN